jgi:hypothetical protein
MQVSFIDGRNNEWLYFTYTPEEREQFYNILLLITDDYECFRVYEERDFLFVKCDIKNELFNLLMAGGMEI